VQTVHLLPAVISVMLNPRKPTFKVTAKDESIAVSRLSEISRPFFVIFAVQIIALIVTIYRIYTEPYKADVTLVVGGWNLINLIMAGCALGVVSERGERASSRRVRVNRRAEFGVNGKWYTASIEDVSVHGARLHVFDKQLEQSLVGAEGEVRFRPFSGADVETLPLIIRNIQPTDGLLAVGCQYVPKSALDHRLIADLMFANSAQWTQFQEGRRRNPGLIRGTIWFVGLALYQTSRGLVYFFRSMRPEREEQRQSAKANG
jgi:cellulose synthase (UDP-forming)